MSYNQKKFLDINGLTHFIRVLDNYPTNDILNTVINAIQSSIDNVVIVSDTQPTESDNKIWIKPSVQDTVQVPTVQEMNQAIAAVDVPVQDVQVNGTSVLNNGIASIDVAVITDTQPGSARTKDFEFNGQVISNEASQIGSFAEGFKTFAKGFSSHTEGQYTLAKGNSTHAEGVYSIATHRQSHAEGFYRAATSTYSHAEGVGRYLYGTISGEANATTYTVNDDIDITKIKIQDPVYLQQFGKVAFVMSVDRINKTITLHETFGEELNNAYVVIYMSYAGGGVSHAEGDSTTTLGICSHAEGQFSITKGYNSHAEGTESKAIGDVSHAEGTYAVAVGNYSHTENNHTFALGRNAHAQNNGENLSLKISGADNVTTYTYSGNGDPSVGDYIVSYENYARITSVDTENKQFTVDNSLVHYLNNEDTYIYRSGAFGDNSHVEGKGTTALGTEQHVQGKYNTLDNQSTYADIVGNGTTHINRSNAYALDWSGNGHFMGDVYVGANADSTGGTKVATVTDIPSVPVQDVQVNGTSVLSNGVANVPLMTIEEAGVAKKGNGLTIDIQGKLSVVTANESNTKTGTTSVHMLTPSKQHISTFYGLSKVAGIDLANETVTLGTYPDNAKTAIKMMLGVQDGLKVVRLI